MSAAWDPFDREAYRECNRVKRIINHLKQFRRGATRYEKLATNYLAMLTLAVTLLWL
jgi:transposase